MSDDGTTKVRSASISRDTKETQIHIQLNLDGDGQADISTGIGFFDHMLHQLARHGRFDISIQAKGDLEIDDHHLVEDVGICLGQAVLVAQGEVRGIERFATATIPLDEALTRVVVDISGRPSLHWEVPFTQDAVGGMDLDLLREFAQGFVNQARLTLHIDNLKGRNAHHQAETIFKALGRALATAFKRTGETGIPSTKGVIEG